MTVLVQLGLWLLRKLGIALVVAAVILLVGGGYLYVNENLRSDTRRREMIETLRAEADALEETAAQLEAKVTELRQEMEKQRQRADVARRLLETYDEMNSWWDWLLGTSIDEETLEEKKKSAYQHRENSLKQIESLLEQTAAVTTEHGAAVTRLSEVELEMLELEHASSPVIDYTRRAWESYKWVLLVALLGFFFGPTVLKVFAYYAIAPLIGKARPIRLEQERVEPATVAPSGVSESIPLQPEEAIFVRERFLQASDETLRRRTRFVLDWSIPVTCAACGLIELVELRNDTGKPGRVTVSTQDDTAIELSIVDVPEAGGVVLRPSFLAGVILAHGRRLEIRRHWKLFHLQSWLTLQFRFFQFRGPCRLVVAGSRGVRAETLAADADAETAGRRTNQDSTIGFTPDLSYRSVRAETFWAYYRDRNPLFDDLFQGSGTFLCQEVASEGPGAKARKFWARLWDGVLKVFGM